MTVIRIYEYRPRKHKLYMTIAHTGTQAQARDVMERCYRTQFDPQGLPMKPTMLDSKTRLGHIEITTANRLVVNDMEIHHTIKDSNT